MFLTEGIDDELAQFVAQTYDKQTIEETMELGDQIEAEKHKIEELTVEIEDLKQKKAVTVGSKQKNAKLRVDLQSLEDQIKKLRETFSSIEDELNQNKNTYNKLDKEKFNAERKNQEARIRA